MVQQWGFMSSKSDNSSFFKKVTSHVLLVLVYVEDIIITTLSSLLVQQIVLDIQHTFALKDLGELNYVLGIEVTKTINGLHLFQAKYVVDLLSKHNMATCSLVPTSMATRQHLTKDLGTIIANTLEYRSLVDVTVCHTYQT